MFDAELGYIPVLPVDATEEEIKAADDFIIDKIKQAHPGNWEDILEEMEQIDPYE